MSSMPSQHSANSRRPPGPSRASQKAGTDEQGNPETRSILSTPKLYDPGNPWRLQRYEGSFDPLIPLAYGRDPETFPTSTTKLLPDPDHPTSKPAIPLEDGRCTSSRKPHPTSEPSMPNEHSSPLNLGCEFGLPQGKAMAASTVSPARCELDMALCPGEPEYWVLPDAYPPLPQPECFEPFSNEPHSPRLSSRFHTGHSVVIGHALTINDFASASYLSDVAAPSTAHGSPGFFSLLSDPGTSVSNSSRSSSNYSTISSPKRSCLQRVGHVASSQPPRTRKYRKQRHVPLNLEAGQDLVLEKPPNPINTSAGPAARSPLSGGAVEDAPGSSPVVSLTAHRALNATPGRKFKGSSTKKHRRTATSQDNFPRLEHSSSRSKKKRKSDTALEYDQPQRRETASVSLTSNTSSPTTHSYAGRNHLEDEESLDSESTSCSDLSSVAGPGMAESHDTSSDDSSAAPRCAQQAIVSATASRLVTGWISQYTSSQSSNTGQGFRKHAVNDESSTGPANEERAERSSSASIPQKGNKRKRKEDDDEKANDKGQDRGRNVGDATTSDTSVRLLACPFQKYDPHRYSERNMDVREKAYRGCSSCYLLDISRLKQHLYRVHSRPVHYCDRCFVIFASRVSLNAHHRQDVLCEIQEPLFNERITEDQLHEIRRRRPGKSIEENWFKIFGIIFPETPMPDSPYIDESVQEGVDSFLRHFRQNAQGILFDEIRNALSSSMDFTFSSDMLLDLVLQQAVTQVLQRLMIGPSVRASREEAVPPPPPRRSPITTPSTPLTEPSLDDLMLSSSLNRRGIPKEQADPSIPQTVPSPTSQRRMGPSIQHTLSVDQPVLVQTTSTGSGWGGQSFSGPRRLKSFRCARRSSRRSLSKRKSSSSSIASVGPPSPFDRSPRFPPIASSDLSNTLEAYNLPSSFDPPYPNPFSTGGFPYSASQGTCGSSEMRRLKSSTSEGDVSNAFFGPQSTSSMSHNSPSTPYTSYECSYADQKNLTGYQSGGFYPAQEVVWLEQAFASTASYVEPKDALPPLPYYNELLQHSRSMLPASLQAANQDHLAVPIGLPEAGETTNEPMKASDFIKCWKN